MSAIEHNPGRTRYLLSLFGMSEDELLAIVNRGRKKAYTSEDLFGEEIELALLKKVDSVFRKGLSYYTIPTVPSANPDRSILFRKKKQRDQLNLAAKQVVTSFEDQKISFNVLLKLGEMKINRRLSEYQITDNPATVAGEVRERIGLKFRKHAKDFLISFIAKLAENNVLVFEFVESPQKREKANIEGFFLQPNVIIIKRQQKYFSREIFTLAHELGHYLLNMEELDTSVNTDQATGLEASVSLEAEAWCNAFAYHFLAGDLDNQLLSKSAVAISRGHINEIVTGVAAKTHLSQLALYTRLHAANIISDAEYGRMKTIVYRQIAKREQQEAEAAQIRKEQQREAGMPAVAAAAKPLLSPLLVDVTRVAYKLGIITEAEVGQRLNLNAQQLQSLLS